MGGKKASPSPVSVACQDRRDARADSSAATPDRWNSTSRDRCMSLQASASAEF